MSWPQGPVAFDVERMVAGGRRINAAPVQDDPKIVRAAKSLVMTAAEYIDGLPEEIQAETAHRLNRAMDGADALPQASIEPLHEIPAARTPIQPLRRARA